MLERLFPGQPNSLTICCRNKNCFWTAQNRLLEEAVFVDIVALDKRVVAGRLGGKVGRLGGW